MKRGKEQNHCRCDSYTIEWLNERIARTIKEQEAGVEGEGGGEDEGGEGDAVGHQDERKEPPSAWTHSPKLISCT